MSGDESHHTTVSESRKLSDHSSSNSDFSEEDEFKTTDSRSIGRNKKRRVSEVLATDSDDDGNFREGHQFGLEDDSDDPIDGAMFDGKNFDDEILDDDDAAPISDSDSDSVEREAFNLEEESCNGVFDQSGNYIEVRKDEEEQEDQWLDDYKDPETLKKAQLAQEKRAKQQNSLANNKSYAYTLEDIVYRLVYFIPIDKDVLNTLALLNKERKQLQKEKEQAIVDEESKIIGERLLYLSHGINRITTLVGALQQKGIQNGYQLDRPGIERLIEEEGLTKDKNDSYQTKVWSFKWLNDKNTVNEYFTSYEMQYWKETYFEGNAIVKYREDPDQESSWVHVDCLTFM
ncbi:AaceriAFR655Cp [[Ashbya] aceris (nom. inval.)]|nr:AaceriAFR655Cp [[Ashbya] aceris (nom. inval.)]